MRTDLPKDVILLPLPPEVTAVWLAVERLRDVWLESKRTFTPDGKLVGDIGEAIAAHYFGLDLCARRVRGVDAYTNDARRLSVQIKTTARPKRGPASLAGLVQAKLMDRQICWCS